MCAALSVSRRVVSISQRDIWVIGLSLVVLLVTALAVRSQRAAEKAEAQAERAEAERAEAQRSAESARNAARMVAARERLGDPTTVLALLREMAQTGATFHGPRRG